MHVGAPAPPGVPPYPSATRCRNFDQPESVYGPELASSNRRLDDLVAARVSTLELSPYRSSDHIRELNARAQV